MQAYITGREAGPSRYRIGMRRDIAGGFAINATIPAEMRFASSRGSCVVRAYPAYSAM